MDRAAIILAAGAGTRMKSERPKVVHEILKKPLVLWVADAAKEAGIRQIVSVVGHKREQVIPLVEGIGDVAIQEHQAGTADAVMAAMHSDSLEDFSGSVIIFSGDCPLIRPETIAYMMEVREREDAACCVLTMEMDDPFGYGRIVKDQPEYPGGFGRIVRIVEQKDGTPEELAITECNSGFYCFDAKLLADALGKVGSQNAQGEYYLTDVMAILDGQGYRCLAIPCDDPMECLGVNSRVQLAEATSAMQTRINRHWMESGVTMMAPETVWIGPDVVLDQDVELLPMTMLFGNTSIGSGSVIGPNSRLTDTRVGNGCTVDETVAIGAVIDDGAECGPRAYLRPEAHLCEGAKAGTHVEIKKSTVGRGSKVPHLSYVGDAEIGEGVNLGAGTITCNYDGYKKHKTSIGDNTFIGSDTMLVAPVSIGADAVVGAGSVITKDIPDGALAVARARERVIDDWASKRKISKEG